MVEAESAPSLDGPTVIQSGTIAEIDLELPMARFNGSLKYNYYYAIGHSLLTSVAVEVVAMESPLPDLPPNLAQIGDRAVAEDVAGIVAEQTPVGNHVVLLKEGGVFTLLAHMKQDSVTVEVGDRVEVGDPLGHVGPTGNSSKPHIYLYAQTSLDLADPGAVGVPVIWKGVEVNGQPSNTATLKQGDTMEPVNE